MTTMTDPREILKLIKILSPKTLPRWEYISREDLTLTNVRDGGIKEDAPKTSDMRYPEPPSFPLGAENAHGEIEMLGDVEATHWYADAEGVTWHFVTTGDPNNEPLVLVHGFPESWFTFHNQLRDLSDRFYCIAVDTLGKWAKRQATRPGLSLLGDRGLSRLVARHDWRRAVQPRRP